MRLISDAIKSIEIFYIRFKIFDLNSICQVSVLVHYMVNTPTLSLLSSIHAFKNSMGVR
jgi:hypothetical protein